MPGPNGATHDIVNPDIDRPLLVLMGGQDTETPAALCASRIEQLHDAPITSHLYPDATHCWGCRNPDNFRKVDVRGSQAVYRYSEEITRDSEERLFDFLAKNMPPS